MFLQWSKDHLKCLETEIAAGKRQKEFLIKIFLFSCCESFTHLCKHSWCAWKDLKLLCRIILISLDQLKALNRTLPIQNLNLNESSRGSIVPMISNACRIPKSTDCSCVKKALCRCNSSRIWEETKESFELWGNSLIYQLWPESVEFQEKEPDLGQVF